MRLAAGPCLLLFAVSGSAQSLEPEATELIRKNCLACHDARAKMGGLVLDSREAALKGGVSGPAIVPGDADASLAAQKVREGKMPAGNPLPLAGRELFARWIDAGAPWTRTLAAAERKRADKTWWSLQPLKKAAPPDVPGIPTEWSQTAIDRFVYAGLVTKGLKPSPPADRRTLIRRVTFDLTGLPPAPEDVEAFAVDSRDDAYERLIDRLLASPAYGERWGRHWMDVIRFGESHGYEQNHLRPNAWPFRDYVIRSFNEDKPFDRMVLEHLAGDQVAPGDPDVEVGTGFLVAGPHDTVGNQSLAARLQQRADDLDDMVNAAASAFLGLTVSCAKCHDHKFDPILQADYYRLQAVFSGVVHGERDLAPAEERGRREQALKPLEESLRKAEERIAEMRKAAGPRMEAEKPAILARYRPAPDPKLTEERFAATPARYVRLRILATSSLASSQPRAAGLDEIEVWTAGEPGRNVALASQGSRVRATSTRRAEGNENAYAPQFLIDGKFDQQWFAADANPVEITVALARTVEIGRVSWSRDRTGGSQGKFDGPVPSLYEIEVSPDGENWKKVATSEGRLPVATAEQEELVLLDVFDPGQQREWKELQQRRSELKSRIAALPKLRSAYIGRFEQPSEPSYLLKRGSVLDRGEVIAPGSLSTLSGALEGFQLDAKAPESERRLALARWITDPRNPLTPRVLANRVWQHHFGRAIAGTPSDFGFNGERPANPELLDYLAGRLLELGWRLKPLHKEILLSAAYRQSSAFEAESAAVDNEARYLWRFPPQRLGAEAVRDSILAVSGKLNRQMGGEGFRLYRYTVDNVATYFPAATFGEETYRRSVYHQAARSVRAELLGQFDCPDSSLPEPKRIVTTSPLQALSLMNNSFMMDQARYFAERLEREAGRGKTAAQIDLAFRLAFGRWAVDEEKRAAAVLISRHGLAAFCRALFSANEFVYVM